MFGLIPFRVYSQSSGNEPGGFRTPAKLVAERPDFSTSAGCAKQIGFISDDYTVATAVDSSSP